MSLKVNDGQGRWRNKTVAFRISPEEDAQLETAVALSGLTKQDYIIRRLQCREVVVQGNPRVYKALRNQLAAVLEELQRIAIGETINADLLDTIELIAVTMNGLKEEL
jgi:acid stress-induced BolA-like protein IbaG/YrbA